MDGFGHVSVRHDGRDDRFLLACGVAPATVTADDIVEVDYDGTARCRWSPQLPERFIHSEIWQGAAGRDGHCAQPSAGDHPVPRHPRHAARCAI